MKGLVASPAATTRRILRQTLASLGVDDIVEARDAAEALERCDADVAIVVAESDLAGMAVHDLVHGVRNTTGNAALPVMLLAPQATRDEAEQARDAGVSTIVLRPFELEFLRARLALLLTAPGEPEKIAA